MLMKKILMGLIDNIDQNNTHKISIMKKGLSLFAIAYLFIYAHKGVGRWLRVCAWLGE